MGVCAQGAWFPSKKLADKSAALEAVKVLDEAGELDPHLKPMMRGEDSDMEVEEEGEEGEGAAKANMDRKAAHYLNKVRS